MSTDVLRVSPDRRDHSSRLAVLRRVRDEFADLPRLRLTAAQARRLFALREDICERVLGELVNGCMLERGDDGRYGACVASACRRH